MSDGSLSQEEIDALLNGTASSSDASKTSANGDDDVALTDKEIDTIGEVANICMGAAATALFSLVNKKVEISTPVVTYSNWDEITRQYEKPCVLIRIGYTKGLNGSNVLVLKENDVKVITDLMMGGDGTNTDGEVSELHLSAISEAMNQMMGSQATSLSSMLNRMIDISPPVSTLVDMNTSDVENVDPFLSGHFIEVKFNLKIGDLVDSKMIQLYPVPLAKEMVECVTNNMESDSSSTVEDSASAPAPAPAPQQSVGQVPESQMQMGSLETQAAHERQQTLTEQQMPPQQQVNVQPAQFSPFTGNYLSPYQPENIDLIKDVPLEVTVELGRTHKSIQDILDFAPGTIIELNKIAGEPIDVLVNGKYVAKGEVVVIEESFGIRITEILK
ncbi:MAG: flagellar motor switch phosphatase FliY [Lachnospiraceae bacterium]|nr:flagellar motor switch phosphatase FliY [Lachnospiraceae bacterium]